MLHAACHKSFVYSCVWRGHVWRTEFPWCSHLPCHWYPLWIQVNSLICHLICIGILLGSVMAMVQLPTLPLVSTLDSGKVFDSATCFALVFSLDSVNSHCSTCTTTALVTLMDSVPFLSPGLWILINFIVQMPTLQPVTSPVMSLVFLLASSLDSGKFLGAATYPARYYQCMQAIFLVPLPSCHCHNYHPFCWVDESDAGYRTFKTTVLLDKTLSYVWLRFITVVLFLFALYTKLLSRAVPLKNGHSEELELSSLLVKVSEVKWWWSNCFSVG